LNAQTSSLSRAKEIFHRENSDSQPVGLPDGRLSSLLESWLGGWKVGRLSSKLERLPSREQDGLLTGRQAGQKSC
ncbi:MAG: hypothetical protein KDA68_12410, partial [Planctomycetaceae bacterium]|nr:hypothetical protein [Planctomycetaceae bacterium]